MTYQPPFDITIRILNLSESIAKELGRLIGSRANTVAVVLRKENKIKTIQASLAIEGNTLNVDQISALLEGKRIIGPKDDILEVENAISVYEKISHFDPLKMDHFLKVHKLLMQGLIKDNGKLRRGNVGICKGEEIMHMAPPASYVLGLMKDLFDFLSRDTETSCLMKACIFHYEMEFIHPFSDGNGRMGRFWQQLLLIKHDPIFQYVSVETVIKEHQEEYYSSLSQCDKVGKSTIFIEFCLNRILEALISFAKQASFLSRDPKSRLAYAHTILKKEWFSRKKYLELHQEVSTSTASRDLLFGLRDGVLKKRGKNNQAEYCFVSG
jgi:Fic family protein